ncbi:hypothetical protein [Dyella sp. EPa41]|uniref:hypothetical protein n=1 Tax=Dyella sp. EPa41 TaxID=1561194 RepID=UPI001916B459|nr:hypothetical protein [Dyella sp. EPa41]
MPIGAGLQQDDVNYLFSLSYGELLSMPLASADRLMADNLIEAVGALDGAAVTGRMLYNVDITRRGRLMVTAVLGGHDRRFIAPHS